MSKKSLKIGGIEVTRHQVTADYNLYVDTAIAFNKPKKNIETVNVPGRNGDLVIDYGTYQNVLITYPCLLKYDDWANTDPLYKYNKLINLLSSKKGYQTIYTDADPGHFREGVFVSQQTPKIKRQGNDIYFDLVFNCKPQRFVYPEVWDSREGVWFYPQNDQDCRPKIRVKGNGTITLEFSKDSAVVDRTVTITVAPNDVYGKIIIDSENMECYDTDNNPVGQYITLSPNDFPVVAADEYVRVSYSGYFTSAEFNMRDWSI